MRLKSVLELALRASQGMMCKQLSWPRGLVASWTIPELVVAVAQTAFPGEDDERSFSSRLLENLLVQADVDPIE